MSAPLRLGLAGCGWVARDFVVPAAAEAEGLRLVAACDPDPRARAALGARAHAAGIADVALHADLDAVLADCDALYVATPNDAHAEVVVAAAAAGRHVLCEKPMATTVGDAERMVSACADAGVVYATAFDQRHHAAHRALRALVAEHRLGTVTQVRVVYQCWLPVDWQPSVDAPGENWRLDPVRAGGGALVDLAPHGLDLAWWLLDEELVAVSGVRARAVHPYEVDDGAVVVARTAGDALVTLQVSYATPDALPRRRLEVVGTAAMAIAVDTLGQTAGGRLELVDARTGAVEDLALTDDRSPFAVQLEVFAAGVAAGGGGLPDPAHDLHTMRLLEAARCDEPTPVGAKPDGEAAAGAEVAAGTAHPPLPRVAPPDAPWDTRAASWCCTNCGFWQRLAGTPTTCPVCLDPRHAPPRGAWDFRTPEALAALASTRIDELAPGRCTVVTAPHLGIGGGGYLLLDEEHGNVLFDAPAWIDDAALDRLQELGGVRWAAASHPHTYGALWRVQERFGCEVAVGTGDVAWTAAFDVTWPVDDVLDIGGGRTLHVTAGHFSGHLVLHDAGRRVLCSGDALKLELDPEDPRRAVAMSTHKGFLRRVPLSLAELRRYRRVLAALAFDEVWTPFEQGANVGTAAAVALLDRTIARRPSVQPVPLTELAR